MTMKCLWPMCDVIHRHSWTLGPIKFVRSMWKCQCHVFSHEHPHNAQNATAWFSVSLFVSFSFILSVSSVGWWHQVDISLIELVAACGLSLVYFVNHGRSACMDPPLMKLNGRDRHWFDCVYRHFSSSTEVITIWKTQQDILTQHITVPLMTPSPPVYLSVSVYLY